MDEITNQLRTLGEATEAAVAETSAATARRDTNEIGLEASTDAPGPPLTHQPASHRNQLLLAAAAAVVIAAIGGALLLRSGQSPPASLETASQTATQSEDFAVPIDDNGWSQLRTCESDGDYQVDSGNTFYGAYQFTWETFRNTVNTLGLNNHDGANPASAPPEIQDAAANALYLDKGSSAWPVCGRHVKGPMITPVIPQLMGSIGRSTYSTIIFISPEVDQDRVSEIAIEIELEAIVDPAFDLDSIDFVSKQQAYDEFQTMFDYESQIAESVQVSDMPASFRIRAELGDRTQLQRLRDIAGVFEVVESEPEFRFDPPPPLKLRIDAISLDTPVFGAATIDNLMMGPAVVGGIASDPAIAGYGSVPGSVFERIDELAEGDQIEITSLVSGPLEDPVPVEIRRTYEVTDVVLVELDQIPPAAETTLEGAVLVADVASDPTLRTLVWTRQITPETSGYGVPPTN